VTTEIKDPSAFLKALARMGIATYVSGKPKEQTLEQLEQRVATCSRCALSETRRNPVFGEGNERAELLFVGEAPGEEEDMQGRPFVGRAGKLLDRLIERIGLRREDVYICNVLKCRPPNNRDPEAEEAGACEAYLRTQIEIVRPKVICTLGRHAYNTLLKKDERITKVRGVWTEYRGIKVLPTYHPSYLLRNERAMGDAYDDMDKLKTFLKAG
jgi:uracil-DNA glycosylase family 4